MLVSGCAVLAPGVGFPVSSKEYSCFIGKRYEVISPLKIVVWKKSSGSYWLTLPITTCDEYTDFITEVPVGSIVVADHVSQGGGYWFKEKWTSYIGRFETPGIFKGGFALSGLIEWKNYDQKAPFCERFAGLNGEYLKELK